MTQPQNVVELLQALVRIPSVNPNGNPGVEIPGEQACAEYVAQFLERCGATTELQEIKPGRPNVIGRFPTNGKKPRLILAPHTDTVSVVGMTIDPFGGEVRDGKIWGRGASDTKGTMAAMLWALYELRGEIAELPYEIWFVGLMGEEAGQDGARGFVKAYSGDFALIGEPTELQVVNTHKGDTIVTLRVRGKAVHSSTPHLGDNAIYKMLDVLECVRREVLPELTAMSDPVLGSPTVSVGTCSGGSKTNIVPDYCEATIDIRTIPAFCGEQVEQYLTEKLKAVCPDLELDFWHARPLATDANHPLVQWLVKNGSKTVMAPWFCDAAVLAAAGIPAVAAGPGKIAQAHTKDEWLSVEDLEAGVPFYKNFIQNCGRA